MVLASLYAQESRANNDYIADVLNIKLKMKFGHLKSISSSGSSAGRKFGAELNLNRQVGATPGPKPLRLN
jgi:hypothetical protein